MSFPIGHSKIKKSLISDQITLNSSENGFENIAFEVFLAYRLLFANKRKALFSCLIVSFATSLILLQFSLLWGFLQAGMVAIKSVEADLWITPKGTKSFDFPALIDSRYTSEIYALDNVEKVQEVLVSFVSTNNFKDSQHSVLIIGANTIIVKGRKIKLSSYPPNSLLVDSTSLNIIGVNNLPMSIEINKKRATIVDSLNGISTFIGGPYAFTSLLSAKRWVGIPDTQTHFIAINISDSKNIKEFKDLVKDRFPNVDCYSSNEFGWKSSLFWMFRTGAGGALLMAAFLGVVIGIIVISQTAYSTVSERLEDLATIRALGGTEMMLRRMAIWQTIGLAGFCGLIGIIASLPIILLTRNFIVAWVETNVYLMLLTQLVSICMALVSIKYVIGLSTGIDPAKVFRGSHAN